ncbi:MAG: SDR family NAD(P)-dependent oxidoreductase [Paracoccaceae bacterium]
MNGWALITGASKGLGREFARLAAADGFNLVLAARSTQALETLAADLRISHGIKVEVITIDLSTPGAALTLWNQANKGHQITTLVNNAGLGHHGRFQKGDGARENTSIALNVAAYTTLTKAALSVMKPGGRILSVASLAAFLPGPNMAVYHATKSYALALDDALRVEIKGTGRSLTTLCPGATKTEFFNDAQVKETWLMRLFPMADAASVARAGWEGMKRGRGTIIPGAINKLFALSGRLLPRALMARLVGIFLTKTSR